MTEICHRCDSPIRQRKGDIGTGYAKTMYHGREEIVCYRCCADEDRKYMKENGLIDLYLTSKDGQWYVTNWPGSLRLKVIAYRDSKTNWGHDRTDVWFRFDDAIWWGYNIGDNEICRCKRTKRTRL